MGWSDEVHARRTLEIREHIRQQKAAGPYAVPELKGNSSLLSLVTLTGALAARAAWQREGRYLRSKDIRRIPFVGPWLAEHVPLWREDSPRRKAGAAAARRARAQATAHSAASASSQHAVATGSSAASTPASTARTAAEQQQAAVGSRKQRNRKRAKRR